MKSTWFNSLYQEYQKANTDLRTKYKEQLIQEIIYNTKTDDNKLAKIFQDIAAENTALAEKAIPELKLQYYNDAAAAYQYVLKFIPGNLETYKKIEQIHSAMVKLCNGSINQLISINSQSDLDKLSHKSELQVLREETRTSFKQIESYKNAGNEELYVNKSAELFKEIARKMEQYLGGLYQSAENMLGAVPCKYAVIGLGSMALRQMTPYSDLECAILISEDDQKHREYFRNLSQLVHFMVINLGETVIPTSRYGIDLGKFIPQAVNFDLGGKTPLGRLEKDKPYELIQTVEEMLKYLKNDGNKSEHIDKNLAAVLQKVCFIYGEKSLVDDPKDGYQTKVKEFLLLPDGSGKLNYEARAIKALWEGVEELDYTKSSPLPKKIEGNLKQFDFEPYEAGGRLFDVKQEIYRLPDRLIYNLGLIYGIQESSGGDTLDKLQEMGHLSKKGADNLKKALTFATNLRLRTYDHYGYQKETLDFSKGYYREKEETEDLIQNISKTFRLKKEELQPTGTLFEYYKVVLPLLEKLKLFCQVQDAEIRNKFFADENFYDNSVGIKAKVHSRLLQYNDALDCYIKELIELKNKYDEKHPAIATSLSNVGLTYKALGQYKEALKYSREALMMIEDLYGKKNPYMTAGLNNVALIYEYLGKHEKALKYGREALMMIEDLYGEKHLDVATSLNNLGATYQALSQYEKALNHQNKALKIRENLLGEEHPVVATSLDHLGAIYHSLNKYQEALYHQNKALKIRENLLGEEHPDVATSLSNVGLTYKALGQYQEALYHQNKALKIRENLLGKVHPVVATSLYHIGTIYESWGEYQKALTYGKQALEMRKKVFKGEDNADLATSLHHIGTIYESWGKHQKALTYGKQALEMRKKVFKGEDNADLATSLNCVGTIHRGLHNYQEALDNLLHALEMRKKVFKGDHLSVAASLNDIGSTYADLDNYQEALDYLLHTLEMRKKLLGEVHPVVARSLNNIGTTYADLGNYQKAQDYLLHALEVQKDLLGEVHPNTLALKQDLSSIYVFLGEYNKALAEIARTCSIAKKIGEEHLVSKCQELIKQYQDNKNTYTQATKLCLEVEQVLEGIEQKSKRAAKPLFNKALPLLEQSAELFNKFHGTLHNQEKLKALELLIKVYNGIGNAKNKKALATAEAEYKKLVTVIGDREAKIKEVEEYIALKFPSNDLPKKAVDCLRIVSYNITVDFFDNKDQTADKHHHWQFRKPIVIKLLDTVYPDVICLQELSPNQALELHQYFDIKLGYSSVFLSQTPSEIPVGEIVSGNNVSQWCGKNIGTPLVGTFISNNYKFLDTGRFWLNEQPDKIPEYFDRGATDKGFGNMNTYRAVLWTKIEAPTDKIIFVFNSHYPLSGDSRTRLECVKLEMQKIKDITHGGNWISAGDRNIIPTNNDNELSNPSVVLQELTKDAKNVKCKHYGINTTWLGFSYDQYPAQVKDGTVESNAILDVIASNLQQNSTFFLHGAFDPVDHQLLPLLGALEDEQNTGRYFASDHALTGADLGRFKIEVQRVVVYNYK